MIYKGEEVNEVCLRVLQRGDWEWGSSEAIEITHDGEPMFYIVTRDDFEILREHHAEEEEE